jgi:hypothetical protein
LQDIYMRKGVGKEVCGAFKDFRNKKDGALRN